MQTEREERPTAGGNRFGGGSRQPLGSPLAAGSRYAARPLRARGLAIGIDIGGTKVAAGVVDPDGTIVLENFSSQPVMLNEVRAVR